MDRLRLAKQRRREIPKNEEEREEQQTQRKNDPNVHAVAYRGQRRGIIVLWRLIAVPGHWVGAHDSMRLTFTYGP